MSSEISDRFNKIYLVGTDNSLNGALSYVFEKEVCSKCILLQDGNSFAEESERSREKVLFLIDCLEKDFEKELVELEARKNQLSETATVALFNLQKGTEIERRAFKKGIRGFFYRNDNLMQMLKGLRSLLQGRDLGVARHTCPGGASEPNEKNTKRA